MEINYQYLRPYKAETVRNLHGNIEEVKELSTLEIDSGFIFPLRKYEADSLLFGRGGCLDSFGRYIDMSGIEKRIYGKYDFEDVDYSDSTVVYCGYIVRHWGHFLIEGITRLWYALRNREDVESYVFFTEYGADYTLDGNYKEFFSLLGILDKIKIINKPTKYKRIIIPERAYQRKDRYSADFLDLLDHICQKAMKNNDQKEEHYPQKVFLSRSRLYSRNRWENTAEFGLDMLDNYFQNNGFSIIYPETLSLSEMIRYLRNADVCASESGSAAHNLLFANTGTSTIIAERQVYPNEFQADIDVMRDFTTVYIDSFYALYPTTAGGGTYLLFYSQPFEQFSSDFGMNSPDAKYTNDRYKKKAIKWYIYASKVHSGYRLMLYEDVLEFCKEYYEASVDSNIYFRSFLMNKEKPSEFIHAFPRRLLRKALGDEKYERLKHMIKG